jgi:hypothetical protein
MGATRQIVVLHLGDHDPSGIDMTRDLIDRLNTFTRDTIEIDLQRIALTMAQIEEVKPPANPAKQTDARFESYRALYGDESWELDALSPTYLHKLVEDNVTPHIDFAQWEATRERIERVRTRIQQLADDFKDE